MRTYVYTGNERSKAIQRLAISTAAMKQPTLVVRFGGADAGNALGHWVHVLPLEVLQLRLPGLDWPLSHTPADEVAMHTTMAILAQLIASGGHRLVILDGIRDMTSRRLLNGAQIQRLAASAKEQALIAMT